MANPIDVISNPENSVLTVGTMILVGGLCFCIWKIGAWFWNLRRGDRTEISDDISSAVGGVQNAVNRLEKKVDYNHDQLHSRVNRLAENDGDIREDIGYLKGQADFQRELTLRMLAEIWIKK